jgi:hypothetical protein
MRILGMIVKVLWGLALILNGFPAGIKRSAFNMIPLSYLGMTFRDGFFRGFYRRFHYKGRRATAAAPNRLFLSYAY